MIRNETATCRRIELAWLSGCFATSQSKNYNNKIIFSVHPSGYGGLAPVLYTTLYCGGVVLWE